MKKQININTFSPIYDATEDRIRVSINYQDINNRIDMMLTRAFLLKLLPTIEEFIYKYYPNEPIEDTTQTSPIYAEDTTQSDNGKSQVKKLPANNSYTNLEDIAFYKGVEDLLITTNVSYDKITKLTTLLFISKENHQASIVCDISMIKILMSSIKKSAPKLKWGIGYL